MRRFPRMVLAVLAAPAFACAHYQHYRPLGIEPQREAVRYRARQLDDSDLVEFLNAQGARVRDTAWTSRELALAALYYRADLSELRSELAAARAGEITAGARPAPSAGVSVEHAARVDEGKSTPWSVSLTAGLTIELGGKRAARIARARASALGARLRLDATGWEISQHARMAAIAVAEGTQSLADQRAEVEQLRTLAQLLRARFAAGEISRAEVARADADLQSASVLLVQSARTNTEARSALAQALAIAPTAVESLVVEPDNQSACDVLHAIGRDSLEALALRSHSAMGVALADYAVAEADLRFAVAQQYPDITIGPGILWDEGVRHWVLSLATPLLPIQISGPVAEARARRAAQAARVLVVEDSVLASVDSSASACRNVTPEVAVADSLVGETRRSLDLAENAYQRGEVGRTEVAFAQLGLARAQHTRRVAAARSNAAGAALEGAVGHWLTGPPIRWPDLTIAPDSSGGSRR
ncbi:MAG TPA: TolC family protein [Gemmatimonadaceae bacterium]